MKKIILIFAHSIEPNGISGSETILIETFRRCHKSACEITLYTWEPGKKIYESFGLSNIVYRCARIPVLKNFHASFFLRSLYGIYLGTTLKIPNGEVSRSILYPGSDFWPDFIPTVLLKTRYPGVKLVGTFFLTSPNPFFGFKENVKQITTPTINAIFYWLMQLPVVPIYNKIADLIFVTSKPDESKFPNKKTYIVRGGVDLESINAYKAKHPPNECKKEYDCVFMGRFHPQKGVLEMIEIWKCVTDIMPEAKIILIGDGPLFKEAHTLINDLNLHKNITLTGYITNPDQKYSIFCRSKVVAHPALYDSGGMAAAEAMAFGLPGVAFDLEALKTYYPKGMIKINKYDKILFAKTIYRLLTDTDFYSSWSKEALNLIYSQWGWKAKSKEIQNLILSL